MFVVVEGSNGAGKTSLKERFEDEDGCSTLSSPNGTNLAKMLRPACRGEDPWSDIDARIQFLLFSAARLDEYIRLVEGNSDTIVADRWWTSTFVYQCTLQGLSVEFMEHTIHPDEKIDLVVILDGDDNVLIERMKSERLKNPKHGICTWTKDESSLRKLMKIYREDLPVYLDKLGINHVIVDTTNRTELEVFEHVKILIAELS